jgi:hypothetical protein
VILATVVVPWTHNYTLDEARFRNAITPLLEPGYPSLYSTTISLVHDGWVTAIVNTGVRAALRRA